MMNRIFAVVLLVMLICGMMGMSLDSSASIASKSELPKFQETPTPTVTPTPQPSPSPSPTATPVPEPEPVPSPTPTPFSRLRDHV